MEHPWYCYTPDYSPLTAFVLYNGSSNVLPVKCLSAKSVNSDVADAVTKYMRQAVVISPHQHLVRLHSALFVLKYLMSLAVRLVVYGPLILPREMLWAT